MASRTRVFISHAHVDDDQALELRAFLRRGERPFSCSVVLAGRTRLSRTVDDLVDHVLVPRIRWSHAVVVVLSPAAVESEWVRWEIRCARACGRPVLLLPLTGVAASQMPEPFDSGIVVAWDVAGIEALARRPAPDRRSTHIPPPPRAAADESTSGDD